MRIRKTYSRAANYVTKAKGAVATANKYFAPQYSGNFQINSTQHPMDGQVRLWSVQQVEQQQSRQQAAGIPWSTSMQQGWQASAKWQHIMTSLAWWPGNKVSSKIKQHQSTKQGNGHLTIPLTTPPKPQNTEQQIPLALVTMTSGQIWLHKQIRN